MSWCICLMTRSRRPCTPGRVGRARIRRVLAIKQTLHRTSGDARASYRRPGVGAKADKTRSWWSSRSRPASTSAPISVGACAGRSWLPRGLRLRRHEDPLQNGAGGARRRGWLAASLLSHRHRKLPPDHGADVRGLRAATADRAVAMTSPTCSTTSPPTARRLTIGGCSSPRRARDLACWSASATRRSERAGARPGSGSSATRSSTSR